MPARFPAVAALGLLPLLLPGCLDATPGRLGPQLCDRWAQVACTRHAGAAGCEAHHRSYCEAEVEPFLDGQLAAAAVTWDEDAATACFDALLATPTSQSPAACDAAVLGRAPLGAACAMTAECGEGAWCDASSGCPGVCAARPAGAPAAPVALPGEGEACSAGGLGSLCQVHLLCVAGLCQPAPGRGDPCPDGACAYGSRCDAAGVCAPYPAHGEPCAGPQSGGLGLGGACAFGWCEGASDADPGTCRAYRGAGAACAAPTECGYGTCLEGRCRIRPDHCGDGLWRVIPNPLVIETSGAAPAPTR
jgi:hypothetical protein